jgi:alkylhydroperoxidase family enzyme
MHHPDLTDHVGQLDGFLRPRGRRARGLPGDRSEPWHGRRALAAPLNSPPIARSVSELGAYQRFESVLSAPVRELTILSSLRETDGRFEWSFHERFAREAGVDDETLAALAYGRDLAAVPVEYAEVIQAVRELLRHKRLSPAPPARSLRRSAGGILKGHGRDLARHVFVRFGGDPLRRAGGSRSSRTG